MRDRAEGWAEGASGHSNKAGVAAGSSESTRRINDVNENETNWTHFCLIMHPAQVKRSEVQRNTCATSKPVGLLLLIDTSEEGNQSTSKDESRTGGKGDEGGRFTRNAR